MEIIELQNTDGQPIGLYAYDSEQHSEEKAIKLIEETLMNCQENDDPQTDADEILLVEHDIERVFAGQATTTVL